jgi:hypothetical protein
VSKSKYLDEDEADEAEDKGHDADGKAKGNTVLRAGVVLAREREERTRNQLEMKAK